MHRLPLAAFAISWALAGSAAAQGQVQPAPTPKTQAQIESQIVKSCVDEGGALRECLCGLGIAREGLTERQFQIFPILWPIVQGKGDALSKFTAGAAALQAHGYTIADGLTLMTTLQSNAARVEKECKGEPKAAPAP